MSRLPVPYAKPRSEGHMKKMKKAQPKDLNPGRKEAQPKLLPSAKNQTEDSEDIERAVYDGMQDLRIKKPR